MIQFKLLFNDPNDIHLDLQLNKAACPKIQTSGADPALCLSGIQVETWRSLRQCFKRQKDKDFEPLKWFSYHNVGTHIGNIHLSCAFPRLFPAHPHLLPPIPTRIEPSSIQAQGHSFFIPNSRMSHIQKTLNEYFLNFAEWNLTSTSKRENFHLRTCTCSFGFWYYKPLQQHSRWTWYQSRL